MSRKNSDINNIKSKIISNEVCFNYYNVLNLLGYPKNDASYFLRNFVNKDDIEFNNNNNDIPYIKIRSFINLQILSPKLNFYYKSNFKRDKENTIILNKNQIIEEHRKMWNWLSIKMLEMNYNKESLNITKMYYLKYIQNLKFNDNNFCLELENACFLCHYTYENYLRCENCLLNWNSNVKEYQCIDKLYTDDNQNLYALYEYELKQRQRPKEAAKYASLIANLSSINA